MTEGNICILHLSDLHIEDASTDGQNVLSDALNKLIEDIKEQTVFFQEIILVVTGDIANIGKISKNANVIIKFFNKLNESVPGKIVDFQAVPGNHDYKRENASANIDLFKETSSKTCKHGYVSLKGYSEYLTIINKINDIFKLGHYRQTYGVRTFDLKQKSICFINMNTSWYAQKDDKRKLLFGEQQLKYLQNAYKNIKAKCNSNSKPICLTVALAHHPLDWLEVTEEELVFNSMMDKGFLNVDLYLCGHLHDSKVTNYFNHEHSIMTLVTGIGWPLNRPNDAKDQHRYSIYNIDVSQNTCDIIMRKSIADGSFEYDYSVYTNGLEKETKKYTYPLKLNNSATFLRLKSQNSIESKSIHVNQQILDKICIASKCLSDYKLSITTKIDEYKNDFFDHLDELIEDKRNNIFEELIDINDINFDEAVEKFRDEIYYFLYENKDFDINSEISQKAETIWERSCNYGFNVEKSSFTSFLLDICREFLFIFNDFFPKEATIRTHFREYYGSSNPHDEKNDKFIILCHETNSNYNPPPKILPFDGLIRASYEQGCNLIYSANKALNNNHPTNWDDFITIIPSFEGKDVEIRLKKDRKYSMEKRPMLTFGISIKGLDNPPDAAILLAIIDYLKINEYLSFFIDEYIRLFRFHLKTTESKSKIEKKQE